MSRIYRHNVSDRIGIYLLVFSGQRCYVGQSNNPERRCLQHAAPSGGWDEPFETRIVAWADLHDAGLFEWAHRKLAFDRGWNVFRYPNQLSTNLAECLQHERLQAVIDLHGLKWPFTT